MAASKLSDEELLDDNLGPSIFTKSTENDLFGEDGDIDEDALLGVDETGGKSVSISFSNDNIHSIPSRHISRVITASHQHNDNQVVLVDEQAFVFDKTDTADLEDELNIAGEDEGQYALQQNEDLMYNEERQESFSDNMYHNDASGVEEEHLDYSNNRLLQSTEREMAYVGQEGYEDTTALYSHMRDGNYPDSRNEDSVVDTSSVELGYEQPITHEEQVHLEYDNLHEHHIGVTENLQEPILSNEEYVSESESDEENSRHNRGKFTSERTGVISLATVPAREAIPDTLEINDEQAAQIEQFMSDKSRGNKANNRGRQSVHSRLGVKPNVGPQPLLPDPRLNNMFQRPRLGHFQNSSNVTFPGGMNQRGTFLNRMIPELNSFPIRPQGQRVPFPPGPPFPFNLPIGQRFPFQNLRPMGRFAGVQRSQFMRSEQKMPQPNLSTNLRLMGPNPSLPSYRMQFGQDIRSSAPSFQTPQPLFRARGKNPNQGQPIPSLIQPVSVPNIPQRPSPHQRLGQMQNKNKIHQNIRSPHPSQGSQAIPQLLQINHPKLMQGDIHIVKKHKIYINPRFQTPTIRHQTPPTNTRTVPAPPTNTRTVPAPPTNTRTVPAQVQKAKAILEKAKQNQLKQTQLTSSLKRKSSDTIESSPSKVIKTEVKTDMKTETVQLEQGEALNEESLKIKALLEEQKQKRELIKKQKEIARQKQAALKRKELEAKMKSEDKLISNIVEAASTVTTGQVKPISAGVASRLGPPPNQLPTSSVTKTVNQDPFVTQANRTQAKFQPSFNTPRQAFAPRKIIPNKLRPATSSESQNTFTVYQQRPGTGLNTPRIPSYDQLRFSVSNTTSTAPSSTKSSDPRFRGPNAMVDPRFRAPNALVDPRFRGPNAIVDSRFSGSNAMVDSRFRGPNAMVDPRFRGPNTSVSPRYRFQQLSTHTPPPQLPAQFSTPPPSNQNPRFQVSQPVNHQHQQPQADSYNFQSFNVQPSQPSQYQPSQASHYPSQLLNYMQPPVQNYMNPPPVGTQHQNISTVSQVANNSEMYNTSQNQQYRNSSSAPTYQAQTQSVHSYYSQIPTSQVSVSSTTGNEQASYGQRIQTIGQHVQPTTGGQIQSILQNVKSAPKMQVLHSTASGSREVTAAINQQVDVYTGPQKIVIFNVPQQATRETIIKICRHFGIVMGANLIRSQNKAIVQFQTGEQAAKCVSKCDQKCLHKTRLTVRLLP